MRGRILLLLAATGMVWVVVADNLPAARARAADWSQPRVIAGPGGITATYPRAWQAFTHGDLLIISSFRIPASWPDMERKRVPAGGIYIMVWSYGPAWKGFPRGKRPLELRPEDHGFYECALKLEGYRVQFTENGRAMQAMVALGPRARTADALGVLNRL